MKRLACLPLLVAIAAIGAASVPSATAATLPGNGQIAFVDTSSGSPSISIANADGSARRKLTRTLPFMSQPSWDPKANRIAFVLGGRVALIRPGGSGLRRIGSPTLPETSPSWSSTGQLAFVRQRSIEGNDGSQLVVARGDGSHQRLLQIPAAVVQPETFSWAKDGRHVLWVVPRGRSAFAAVASLDVRSGAVTTRAQPTRCVLPAVRQPGGTLSVCFQAESSPPRLKLLRAGTRLGSIGHLTALSISQPAWSPLGSRLAYAVDRQHVAVLTFAAGVTRTYAVPMRAPAGEQGTATVSWSPDGFHLVVGSNQAGGWKLYEIDLHDGRVTTLAAHTEDSSPQFSPDGQQLAFVHTPARGARQLRVIDGTPRTLISGVGVDPWQVDLPAFYSWSPDSRSIAYTTPVGTLATVDVASRAVQALGKPATGQPFWSPDGSAIAWTAARPGRQQQGLGPVRVLRLVGPPPYLTTVAQDSAVLGFTPDGTGLLVTSASSAASIVSVSTGSTVSSYPGSGWFGSSLSPDGSSVLLTTFYEHEGFSYGIGVLSTGAQPSGSSPVSSGPAVWSPDGHAIAFSVAQGLEAGSVQVAPVADLGALGPPIAHASQPTWQPVRTT